MTNPTPIPNYVTTLENALSRADESHADTLYYEAYLKGFGKELLALVRTLERERDEARHGLYNAVYGGQSIAFDEAAYPPDWPGNIDDGPPVPPELHWMVDGALAADTRDVMSVKGIPEWDHHLDRWCVTVIDRDGGLTRYACKELVEIVQRPSGQQQTQPGGSTRAGGEG